MGRTKGARNKEDQPADLSISDEQCINELANIILEMIAAEQAEQSQA